MSLECSILNYDARVYTRVEKGVDVLEDTLNAGEFVSILYDGSLLPLFEVGEEKFYGSLRFISEGRIGIIVERVERSVNGFFFLL